VLLPKAGNKNPAIQHNNPEDLNPRILFYASCASIVTIIVSFIIIECVTMFFNYMKPFVEVRVWKRNS
jgi:hypothetical protein